MSRLISFTYLGLCVSSVISMKSLLHYDVIIVNKNNKLKVLSLKLGIDEEADKCHIERGLFTNTLVLTNEMYVDKYSRILPIRINTVSNNTN